MIGEHKPTRLAPRQAQIVVDGHPRLIGRLGNRQACRLSATGSSRRTLAEKQECGQIDVPPDTRGYAGFAATHEVDRISSIAVCSRSVSAEATRLSTGMPAVGMTAPNVTWMRGRPSRSVTCMPLGPS